MRWQPICVSFALAVPALAQEPALLADGIEEVGLRLASDEPARVAWGAALAGRLRLREAVPGLRAALRAWTRSGDEEAGRVRYFLLDALAELGTGLPGEELAPQLEGYLLPPALVIAARDPEAHGALLFALLQAHWEQGDPDVRQAAGNLLAATKAAGFAAFLMRRLPLRLHVTVRDEDPAMMGVGTGGAGASFEVRSVALPSSYPPVPRYRLTTQAEHGARLLAAGTTPVYWRRTEDERRGLVVEERRSAVSEPGPSVHRWLSTLLRNDLERLGLRLFRCELVRFEDAESYVRQVVAWRAEIEAAYADVARRLVVRGALTEAEAGALELPLEVEVADERVDRSVALPALPAGR